MNPLYPYESESPPRARGWTRDERRRSAADAPAYPAFVGRLAAGDQLGAPRRPARSRSYRNGILVGTVTLTVADQAHFGALGGYIGLVDVGAPGAKFDNFGGGTVTP